MNWKRLIPLTGLVFAALIIVSIILSGSTPDSDASAQKVVSYYTAHDSRESVAGFLGGFAVVFFLFFLGTLRGELRRQEEPPGILSATAFAGGIILAVGGATFSAFTITLADNPDKLDPSASQAINALSNDFFVPFAVGALVFLIAAGIAMIRGAAFPTWLGWLGIVAGVLNFTPLFFLAGPLALLWVVIVSVMLSLRAVPAAAAPSPPHSTGPLA